MHLSLMTYEENIIQSHLCHFYNPMPEETSHGSALNAVLSSDVLLWNQVLATTVAALLKSLLE